MGNTHSTREYNFIWLKFWKRLGLWLLGIPINFVPILFKHISSIQSNNWSGFGNLLQKAIGDIDFLFLSISVVFILCIEGYFAGENHVAGYRACQCISLIYFVILLLVYCVVTFSVFFHSLFTYEQWFQYNLSLIAITVILGVACISTLSMEKNP